MRFNAYLDIKHPHSLQTGKQGLKIANESKLDYVFIFIFQEPNECLRVTSHN
jgi:hypothetical protein